MKRPVITVSAMIVVAGLFGNYLHFIDHKPDRQPVFDAVPYTLQGYTGEERRFEDYSYEILKADTTTLRYYHGPDGQPFWLFVAYFASQRYGSQIHSPKHCLPGGGWRIDRLEPFALALPDGSARNINRLIIAEGDKRELMFYWFETRSGTIRNEFGLKWDLMKNSLLLRPTDAAIIRLTTPFNAGDDIKAVTAKAVAYLDAFYPSIDRCLPFGH